MFKTGLLVLAVAAFSYGYGVLSHAYRIFPIAEISAIRQAFMPERGRPTPSEDRFLFTATDGRKEVECRTIRPDAAVILAMGQSNAANHGTALYRPRQPVFNYNWLDGKCYRAEDPLLGATGDGGSVWTRLGDMLVERGLFRQVLLVSVAVGGTSMRNWAGENGPASRAVRASRALERFGLKVTHVLWHQGESDWQMSPEVYTRLFGDMVAYLRKNDIRAPIFVAMATICRDKSNAALREAQMRLPTLVENVYRGPDTDRLDRIWQRPDGCHFSGPGFAAYANLWLQAMAEPKTEPSPGEHEPLVARRVLPDATPLTNLFSVRDALGHVNDDGRPDPREETE